MELADDSGKMNIWVVILHAVESLYVFAQAFAILLGDEMQITCLARSRVAPYKGPTNSWHRSDQEEMESTGRCINHDLMLGLSTNGK